MDNSLYSLVKQGSIKSIQRGTFSGTGIVIISPVNMNKSTVNMPYSYTASHYSSTGKGSVSLILISSTELQVTQVSSISNTFAPPNAIPWEVIEYV